MWPKAKATEKKEFDRIQTGGVGLHVCRTQSVRTGASVTSLISFIDRQWQLVPGELLPAAPHLL